MQLFSCFCILPIKPKEVYFVIAYIYKIIKVIMKNSTLKDIVIVGAFAGFAYYVSRYYRQKKQKERELRETLHFQLF